MEAVEGFLDLCVFKHLEYFIEPPLKHFKYLKLSLKVVNFPKVPKKPQI
jgi:hypothetical protein